MSDIYITWDDYNKKIEELAIKVYQDGCKFNQVICIAKGGLRVGDIFSRLFDVPLAIMSVESYKKGTGNILDQQGQFTFSRDLAKTTPNLGSHVLLVDDLLATGGTAEAGVKLVEKLGGNIVSCNFIINLPNLGGDKKLADLGISTHFLCSFEGI